MRPSRTHWLAFDRTQAELADERAAVLRRIARGLESALARVEAQRRRVLAAPEADRPREQAAYTILRKEAERHRWYLEVQREALGLRSHAILDEIYSGAAKPFGSEP